MKFWYVTTHYRARWLGARVGAWPRHQSGCIAIFSWSITCLQPYSWKSSHPALFAKVKKKGLVFYYALCTRGFFFSQLCDTENLGKFSKNQQNQLKILIPKISQFSGQKVTNFVEINHCCGPVFCFQFCNAAMPVSIPKTDIGIIVSFTDEFLPYFNLKTLVSTALRKGFFIEKK